MRFDRTIDKVAWGAYAVGVIALFFGIAYWLGPPYRNATQAQTPGIAVTGRLVPSGNFPATEDEYIGVDFAASPLGCLNAPGTTELEAALSCLAREVAATSTSGVLSVSAGRGVEVFAVNGRVTIRAAGQTNDIRAVTVPTSTTIISASDFTRTAGTGCNSPAVYRTSTDRITLHPDAVGSECGIAFWVAGAAEIPIIKWRDTNGRFVGDDAFNAAVPMIVNGQPGLYRTSTPAQFANRVTGNPWLVRTAP